MCAHNKTFSGLLLMNKKLIYITACFAFSLNLSNFLGCTSSCQKKEGAGKQEVSDLPVEKPTLRESAFSVEKKMQKGLSESILSKRKLLSLYRPYLKSDDEEIKSVACLACALLGDQNLEKVGAALVQSKESEIVSNGIMCLALQGGNKAVKMLAPLVHHSDSTVRNTAGSALAQYVNNAVAAKALKKIISDEKESHVRFNTLAQLPGWTEAELVRTIIRYAEEQIARDKNFNDQAVTRVLGVAAKNDDNAYGVLKKMLDPKASEFTSRLTALKKLGAAPQSTKIRELLQNLLVDSSVTSWYRGAISEALSSFRNLASLPSYEAALKNCRSDNCDQFVWDLAQFEGKAVEQILLNAKNHKNARAARAANEILEYKKSKDKDGNVKKFLDIKVKKGGKLLFDNQFFRSNLILMAARQQNGLSKKTLEGILLLSLNPRYGDLSWHKLTYAYLHKFADQPNVVAEFLLEQKDSNVIADIIVKFLLDHPTKEVCDALFKVSARGGLDARFNGSSLLAMVRMRQAGHCLYDG